MIEVKGITKTYGAGESTTAALKNVDLQIADGDFTVILARRGRVNRLC